MNCDTCTQKLPSDGAYLICNSCSHGYHFGACCGVSANTWRAKSEAEKLNYKCKSCRSDKSRSGSTSSQSGAGFQSEIERGFEVLKNTLMEMFNERFNAMDEKISALQNTVLRFDSLFDEFKIVKKDIEDIKKQNEINIRKLNEQTELVVELQNQVNYLDQYSRNHNLEIQGVPYSPNEDMGKIISGIANKCNIDVNMKDLVYHRVGHTNERSSIVVQFSNRNVRNEFLSTGKRLKLKLNDINAKYPDKPLYINEHLTSYNKKLLFQIKQIKYEKQWKFVWFANSKILVKKNESSKPIWIRNLTDLEKIN
jgi:hypothetical protein